jgi:hypothetical protein
MKKYLREHPQYSLCGLSCLLCPMFNTTSPLKCVGCGGPDFFQHHPACPVITCTLKHNNVQFCFECSEFPCKRYESIGEKDSFISYKNMALLGIEWKHRVK